ncbi:anthrax toxin lethal factor-related metalloendopeptidase [Phocicoccus pinnipedialis]|uniref:ATLF-like domain-containing protein n=1 Tax=Phocicoccus pinnipedialis TaxID=110845 RepID=A0A6V7R3W4_9BACL|nr:hypothetical protein [Jeotgalicoccus pinnipedialis]MBP1939991.1 hypothetical protein [Jeotgalicoccus pinnipedialis]CAD2072061.1 hypothetical protein JEOPIN946_00259 [Jeotgalicoccus pinnipedialis]
MKKFIMYCMLGLLFIILPTVTSTQAAEINPYLEKIIDLRIFDTTEKNNQDAAEMIERLDRVDDSILRNVSNSGARMILSDKKLVELPEFEELRGVIPRGHTEPWDNVPGLGGFISYAAIGKSEPSIKNNHGDINLELHEFGHIVDMYTFEGVELSATEEFRAAHKQDKDNIFPEDDYFNYVDEYFAEAFAYYYYTEASKHILYEKAPSTARFFDNLHTKILMVIARSEHSFKIVWDEHNQASTYMVRVNDKEYDVTEPEFSLDNLLGNSSYKVQVFTKDANGKVISSSYEEVVQTLKYENIDVSGLVDAYNEIKAIDVDNRTEALNQLKAQSDTMFTNIEQGRISQEKVDKLTDSIMVKVNDIKFDLVMKNMPKRPVTGVATITEENPIMSFLPLVFAVFGILIVAGGVLVYLLKSNKKG